MSWPLITPPVPASEIPIFNAFYLDLCRTPCDPTMVWGTEVETGDLDQYLRRVNQSGAVLVSRAHVLLQAVGWTLTIHPQFNRRVLGRRVYAFKEVNALMALHKTRQGEADLFLMRQLDTRSVRDIAQEVWRHNRQASEGQFTHDLEERLLRWLPRPVARALLRAHVWITNNLNLPASRLSERLRSAAVLVNYLDFKGAAPLRAYKPSRFPLESCTLNVTMGPSERRPVVDGERVTIRSVAHLFVRADHRIIDAYDLGGFVGTLKSLIENPWKMDSDTHPSDASCSLRFVSDVRSSNGHGGARHVARVRHKTTALLH